MIPTTISASPIIQANRVIDIVAEQEVLPHAQEAKESDEMIMHLSKIDINAYILHNFNSYKPGCVFQPDVKNEHLALWGDWHGGIQAIHRNKYMLKVWKRSVHQIKRRIYLV
jgi:hypothetical protein